MRFLCVSFVWAARKRSERFQSVCFSFAFGGWFVRQRFRNVSFASVFSFFPRTFPMRFRQRFRKRFQCVSCSAFGNALKTFFAYPCFSRLCPERFQCVSNAFPTSAGDFGNAKLRKRFQCVSVVILSVDVRARKRFLIRFFPSRSANKV